MSMRRYFGERFTSVDTAWLHMDSPTNLAVITGVITFSQRLEFVRLAEVIEERLLGIARFRQRVFEPPIGPPRWVFDKEFDLDNHMYRISIPEPADTGTLQEFVSEMMSIPLEMSKPLWELYCVDNYQPGGALICRFHHCLADGLALIQVLLATAEEDLGTPELATIEDPFAELSPLARLFVPAVQTSRALQDGVQRARSFVRKGLKTATSPRRLYAAARTGAAGGLALGKLLLLPPDRKTLLTDQCGGQKKVAWSKAITVSEVKDIGIAFGGTINDILLSAMTGGIRRYLVSRGEEVDGLDIHAIVPVNLRPAGDISEMGNRFGLVFLALPVCLDDPHQRLKVLKQRMDAIKATPEAVVAFGILITMGISPDRIEDLIRELFGKKGSLVITNVPGPRRRLKLAGAEIDGMMFWVPTPANLGLGVSIISFAGDVMVGVGSDVKIVPDPQNLLDMFYEEFEYLRITAEGMDISSEMPAKELPEPESAPVNDAINKEEIPPQEPAEPIRCQALTLKGTRCKNQALAGSDFCFVHKKE